MKIDLSVPISREDAERAGSNENKALQGHLGTHFDAMDKEFPLDCTELHGIAFDASGIEEITAKDIDLGQVGPGMFVAFHTGWLNRHGYGTKPYITGHPELSDELIGLLLDRGVRIIACDLPGIRRGPQHTPADQRCADRGTFVVENVCNLDRLLQAASPARFLAHTYPLHYVGMSGIPARVIAEQQ